MSISSTDPKSAQPRASSEEHDAAKAFVLGILGSSESQVFSARDILHQNPSLQQFPSIVIDLAYEEYCRRREADDDVRASEFVRDFSGVEQSLFRVIECDQVLREHPSLIENVPEERWPNAGDEFCGFQLIEQIGRGVMSRVFLARQPGLGMRQVVAKICIRGEREADLLGKLEHERIAPVYSIHSDSETGLAAICMPFLTRVTMHHVAEWLTCQQSKEGVTGGQIREEIRRLNLADAGSPTAERRHDAADGLVVTAIRDEDSVGTAIMKWGVELADALAHAHSRKILHCDVKPGNVLLLENMSASLLDFNLASSADDAIRLAGGTLPYMASEQLHQLMMTPQERVPEEPSTDQPPAVSEQTDVFGLCATLWHLATGEPPFGVVADLDVRNEAAALMLHRQVDGITEERMQRIRTVLPDAAVETLIKGLHTDPSQRPQGVQEVGEALRALLPKPASSGLGRRAALLLLTLAVVCASLAWTPPGKTLIAYLTTSDPAAVEEQAHALIGRRQLTDARALVGPFTSRHAGCRFADLLCRTCELQSMTLPSGRVPLEEAELEVNKEWDRVAEEWRLLVQDADFEAAASFNLAFVLLEFGQPDAFDEAGRRLERAHSLGLSSDASQRVRSLLLVRERQEVSQNKADMAALSKAVLTEGTRGEFLAFLAALKEQFLLVEEQAEVDSDLNDRLAEAIGTYDKAATWRAEPQALRLVMSRFLDFRETLRTRAFQIINQTAAPDEARPNFNRLIGVLQLPPE